MGADRPGDELYGGLLRSGRADATVVRMLLGYQLRRLREAVGITPDQAPDEIRASRAKIIRMENGRVGFKARDPPVPHRRNNLSLRHPFLPPRDQRLAQGVSASGSAFPGAIEAGSRA